MDHTPLSVHPPNGETPANYSHLSSSTLKIEDLTDVFSQEVWRDGTANGIRQLSQSPVQRRGHSESSNSRFLTTSHMGHSLSEDDLRLYNCPSSPLLVAMRDAVDSLNKYEDFKILEKIGEGFFAEVYKVIHLPTDQEMVLKINKRMTGIKKLKEVELLKKLQHPNILHYVGACVHKGQLHPLTEFMNGGALEQLIQNKTVQLSWSQRLNLALDIALGMEYLHRHGMFHRDLNSKNVLLRKQEDQYTAVVADFGLAAKTPSMRLHKDVARQQSIVGNPYWMAPEVIHGRPYNEKADVFSYGIVLCEIITRLDADPEALHRTQDFGMDAGYVKSLPETKDCPLEFFELAFQCCKIPPTERPTFSDACTRLLLILDLYKLGRSQGDVPQPRNRLSYHESHSTDGRPRARSFTPPVETTPPTLGQETTV